MPQSPLSPGCLPAPIASSAARAAAGRIELQGGAVAFARFIQPPGRAIRLPETVVGVGRTGIRRHAPFKYADRLVLAARAEELVAQRVQCLLAVVVVVAAHPQPFIGRRHGLESLVIGDRGQQVVQAPLCRLHRLAVEHLHEVLAHRQHKRALPEVVEDDDAVLVRLGPQVIALVARYAAGVGNDPQAGAIGQCPVIDIPPEPIMRRLRCQHLAPRVVAQQALAIQRPVEAVEVIDRGVDARGRERHARVDPLRLHQAAVRGAGVACGEPFQHRPAVENATGGHACRGEDPLLQVVRKRPPGGLFDQQTEQEEAIVVVPPLLARALQQRRLDPLAREVHRRIAAARGGLPPRVGVAPGDVGKPRGVAEQLGHRHLRRRRPGVERRQVFAQCPVQPQRALLDQLHGERGDQRLAQRADPIAPFHPVGRCPFNIGLAVSGAQQHPVSPRHQHGAVEATVIGVAVDQAAQFIGRGRLLCQRDCAVHQQDETTYPGKGTHQLAYVGESTRS